MRVPPVSIQLDGALHDRQRARFGALTGDHRLHNQRPRERDRVDGRCQLDRRSRVSCGGWEIGAAHEAGDGEAVLARGPGRGIDLGLRKRLFPLVDCQREVSPRDSLWPGC